jgi:DDB1- and CUL4-associated factor 1
MWEPVLQDKRQEHIKFCKYAAELIELVSGKPPHTAVDPSLDRIRQVVLLMQKLLKTCWSDLGANLICEM